MTKRILAIILSVTMIVTFLPVATFAGGSPVRIAATPGAGLISTGEGEPRTSVDSPWYDGGDRDGDITFSIADGDNGTSVLTLDYYNPREVREVTEVYTAIPQEGFMFDGWTYSYWDAADDEVKTQALTDGTVLAKENAAFLNGPIMANFKAEEITIADILPADFPTDDYDPWYNSENDDVCLYLDEDNSKLVFDNTPFSDGVLISSVLSEAEKDPTWADTTTRRLEYSADDIIIQFNMTGDAGDELENIVVTYCFYSGVEGTYEPSKETDSHTHGEGDDAITFDNAWTSVTSLPATAGNYYLDTDVTLSRTWSVPTGTVNLCLNGHVIKQGKTDTRVISVPTGATLNLYDCGTTAHAGYVDANGLWHLGTGTGTETSIKGGVITGGNVTDNGGGVYVNGGIFTMNSGNISGNTAFQGGGVYVSSGNFTMNGGTITVCTAKKTIAEKGHWAAAYMSLVVLRCTAA